MYLGPAADTGQLGSYLLVDYNCTLCKNLVYIKLNLRLFTLSDLTDNYCRKKILKVILLSAI